ncbi:MAG: hypothetical protein EXS03_05085 [Phycisphaerales bacterium]|nr:hypothetical protein [Phycisphaerales bacterium]
MGDRARASVFSVERDDRAPAPLSAEDLMPPLQRSTRWLLIDEVGRPTDSDPIGCTAKTSLRCGGSWEVLGPAGDIDCLIRGDDGSATLCASLSRVEGTDTLFDPPLAVVPATLTPTDTAESSSAMRVMWADGSGERDHGQCWRTMRIVGCALVTTPAGLFSALEVESVFTARLSTAAVQHTSRQWIVRGVGAIAQRWNERVTVLGVPVRQSRGGAIRLPPFSSQ